MNKAFIFPGQASQYVGMAADLYEKYDLAKDYFEIANDIMGMDLKKICFQGPEEELKQTYITQPAIYVHSVLIADLLKQRNINPNAVAGHSLGEYCALVTANVLDFESGLKLVKERSRLMFEAGKKRPGTMGAIIGLSSEQIAEICQTVQNEGIVQPANFNSPGQIVVSGEKNAVLAALDKAKEAGARLATELVVSGAFHSPLMLEAQQGLSKALNETKFNDAKIPVYTNVTSKPVLKADELRSLLLKQLTSPVLWQKIIVNMVGDGHTEFIEAGPGNVLKGLLKRTDRNASCEICGTVEHLESFGE
jgi:[acyl-carrier-protein] S-malonyltransferase